jgi:DNA-binding CsgD family transcriptional regulator
VPADGETTDRSAQLQRGRAAVARSDWAEAYDALSQAQPLGADDLQLLATAAYLLGRLPKSVTALRSACEALLAADEPRRAARAVFWMVFLLSNQGQAAQAAGWLARAEHLLADQPADCAERGLVLGAKAFGHIHTGEYAQALEPARQAIEIGRRSGDPDVLGLALTRHAGALIQLGRVAGAMPLLDEAMVAVVSAEISPIAAGTVYCTVIFLCQEIAELRRAQEWTEALDTWCAEQPEMLAFSGQCRIHRAELLQLHGHWSEAIDEAERACLRLAGSPEASATGAARYRQAEVLRMRGDYRAAQAAYQQAGEFGHEPCPGLALLRLAQGDRQAADAAIGRALGETTLPLRRAGMLPARVEIALAAGDLPAARRAADELAAIAAQSPTPALQASAHWVTATVLLAEGEPAAALTSGRAAGRLWRELDVPYEVARAREVTALSCRALGDADSATLELAAAERIFAQLGAEPDRARAASLGDGRPSPDHPLTARELEVLRLAATGKTNRAIAAELGLSDKTVERHLSNLFTKIGVSSRSAATAYAYEHKLV